jgi:hypothetical protein
MLFLWDNGGRLHFWSDSSQWPERAARSSYRFATLITGCLSSSPFCPLGRLTTSTQASQPVKRLDWQRAVYEINSDKGHGHHLIKSA